MTILCCPCSSKSAGAHFDDLDKHQISTTRRPQSEDGPRKPTGAEYAAEAAKEFLNVLEAVAQEIPVPGVGIAVQIAANLIRACEEGHATLEKAEELKLRIKMLVTVVVNELKGKKPDEIREKLKEDVEALQSELKYIEKKLDEIASQHALLIVFFRGLNDEKVKNCMSRLDRLLERFTIVRQIDHSTLLDRLEKEILGFYKTQKQTLDEINRNIEDLRAMMSKNVPVAGFASTSARATIPAYKSLFYGRDALVSDLVAHLTNSSDDRNQHHTCILGAGGMGKTSTALAVMAHADVKSHYPESQRVWVPCVKATSGALLLDTLASSLGITQMTGNIKENIMSVLKSAGPLILLLDNFETPWNADDGRLEAEQILCDIDQIPHITIFVTMRSSTAPCDGLSWHSIDLKAVDAEAALQIYSKIYPDSSADLQVSELLQLVGHMPLAITLMATTAKLSKLSAKDLIRQYEKSGTVMISPGLDSNHSMDVCIGLSVESPPMKKNPDAQRLLAVLSMLPVGTTFDMLTTWWARDLSNITVALHVLRETSLIELQDSTYSVLPVIQRYVTHPSRYDVRVRGSMILSACDLLENHKSSSGDSSYNEDAAILAAEDGNLEAILLQATSPSTELLNALLVLAKHQAVARPRTTIINHALTFAQQMGNQGIHGAVLSCYGSICFILNRYTDSRKYYTDAREIYLSLSDIKQAAQSLLECVKISQFEMTVTHAMTNTLTAQAESEFELAGDAHGVAQCQLIRGVTAFQAAEFDEASKLLLLAQDQFKELGSPSKSAECSHVIAWCYYWQDDFEQAKTWAESALEAFDRLGPLDGNIEVLMQLGNIYTLLGTYVIALQMLTRFLERSKASAGPLYVALALEQIAVAWLQMGKTEDARGAFQEALDTYPDIPTRHDQLRCRYWLKKVEDPSTIAAPEEWEWLVLDYPPKALETYGIREV